MRKIFLTLLIIFLCNPTYSLEIFYPEKEITTKKTSTTFFIGNANPNTELTVNGYPIQLHNSGGFAHFVNLENGKNVFKFKNGDKEKTYTIIKEFPTKTNEKPSELTLFETPQTAVVLKTTPLRSTPSEYGINRLSHLQPNIQVIVIGEKNQFYNIRLNKNKTAWILKKDLKFENVQSGKVENYKYRNTKNYYIFEFDTTKRLPFVIEEKNGLKLTFYNVSNQQDSIYTFQFLPKIKLIGYTGYYDDKDKFILKVRKYPKISKRHPLKNIRITIDAGHGGTEQGAIGCLGTKEKEINLSIAKALKKELENCGAKVIMTREEDVEIGLKERVDITNNHDSMIFLSIHNNAVADTKNPNEHSGSSVYYYYPQAQTLAQNILNSIVNNTGLNYDGEYQRSFAVVRNTQALSILIEFAYLINPNDNATIVQKNFPDICTKSIVNGIKNWFCNTLEEYN